MPARLLGCKKARKEAAMHTAHLKKLKLAEKFVCLQEQYVNELDDRTKIILVMREAGASDSEMTREYVLLK